MVATAGKMFVVRIETKRVSLRSVMIPTLLPLLFSIGQNRELRTGSQMGVTPPYVEPDGLLRNTEAKLKLMAGSGIELTGNLRLKNAEGGI